MTGGIAWADFYPRSPRGERPPEYYINFFTSAIFLSTLPARGATLDLLLRPWVFGISIHAPREGSDGTVGGFSPYAV